MAYVSLYRKYRPQTFDEVVGQEHVTTTLQNAISAGRVGSGYLFTGTRGTAKTTCARILAKALNCIGVDGTRNAPSPTPCGVCGPCKSIASSNFVDVLEMDAASHGKVDDVRDLVASIKFPPMEGRYKVYIIDEAHQLSRDAMDAFLKTLEEPPDRVVFVLATTELDKLPITIASRCQVFEFKRGSVAAISSRLSAVLGFENVAVDPAAITLVARAADGSYRDSLSLLEQVLAYKPNDVTAQDVSRVLGTVDDDMLTDIVARIAAHDAAGAFAAADSITSAGKDVRQFLRTLSARLRDMLFVAVGATSGASEISASARAQVGALPTGTLLRALEILSEVERDMRWSNMHRLILEITLLRLCSLGAAEIAFAAPVPGAVPVAPSTAPASHHATPAALNRPTPAAAPVAPNGHTDTRSVEPSPGAMLIARDEHVDARPPATTQQTSVEPSPGAMPVALDEHADARPPATTEQTPVEPGPVDVIPVTTNESMPIDPGIDDVDLDEDDDDSDVVDIVDEPEVVDTTPFTAPPIDDGENLLQVQQIQSEPAPVVDTLPSLPANSPAELVRLQRAWQEVVNTMGSRSPSGAAMIREATPIGMDGSMITLKFTNKFNVERLAGNERGRKAIEDIINKQLGVAAGTYRIRCVLNDPPAAANAPVVARQSVSPVAAPHEEPDELLETVIAVFGGSVIDE